MGQRSQLEDKITSLEETKQMFYEAQQESTQQLESDQSHIVDRLAPLFTLLTLQDDYKDRIKQRQVEPLAMHRSILFDD